MDLARRGVDTIRALSKIDEATLSEWYGARNGPWLWRRCRFDDDAPVVPVREPVSESRENTFSVDLADRDDVDDLLGSVGDLGGGLLSNRTDKGGGVTGLSSSQETDALNFLLGGS